MTCVDYHPGFVAFVSREALLCSIVSMHTSVHALEPPINEIGVPCAAHDCGFRMRESSYHKRLQCLHFIGALLV